ncbi:Panacea domain-containing protein [Bacillus safensis]|uniref:Panacea domain-containing protein n=1 Tax=Bacillus safensis TaxID=561879 RepID=UPI003F57958A
MAYHFIAIISDFSGGRRIGWHYSSEDRLDKEYISEFFETVKKKCGKVQFGIHKLSTDSTSWESVTKKDSFFGDVAVTGDITSFIEVISRDKELTAYDVAKFVLSFKPYSHLKLQKLLYYIYAEFLLKTGEKLFKDPILAFKYGPVVEDIFYKYKSHGKSIIDYQEDATIKILTDDLVVTPSFMKVVSSEYGIEAVESITKVLFEYGDYAPFRLVNMTHQEGGPWQRAYEPGQNCVITDELITQYHQYAT